MLATIWSAPLLLADFGVTTTRAVPVESVDRVAASNALRPNAELTLTIVPAATAKPFVSLTKIDRVAGALAATAELPVIVMDGVSANSCTTSVLWASVDPKLALAVSVSPAVIDASVTVTDTLATPERSVTAEGAPSFTLPPTEAKLTSRFGTRLPPTSLTVAMSVRGGREPRSVDVGAMVKLTVGALPVTLKPALPCAVAAPPRTTATT